MRKSVGFYKLTTFIGIIVIILAAFFHNNYNINKTNNTVYLKIIENIFRENGQHIELASALWGKGDVPLIKQLDTNYSFDSFSTDASNNMSVALKNDDHSEKYYQIMDLIKEVPNLTKNESVPLDINNIDYYIFGANVTWENKTQRKHYIRLFVDKNNNIYLPELYPYHDSNSSIEENKFMVFKANNKAEGLIESILKDVK